MKGILKNKTFFLFFIMSLAFLVAGIFIFSFDEKPSFADRRIIGEIILNFDSEVKWNGELEGNIIAGEEIGRNVKYQIVEADGYKYQIVAPIYNVTLRLTRDSNEVLDITEPGSRQNTNFSGSSLTYSKGIVYYNFNDWIYNSTTGKAHNFYAIEHYFKGEYPGTLIKREEWYPANETTLTGDMRDDWVFTYTLNVTPKNVIAKMVVEYQQDNGSFLYGDEIGREELSYGNRFTSVNASNYSFIGRHFDGWYHNGDKVSSNAEANLIADMGSITQNDVENLETNDFYARFALNSYNVVLNSNDNRSLTVTQNFTYGQSQNLIAFPFAKNGYSFLGWSTSPTGNVIYADQQSVSNLTAEHNGTVNLYAIWDVATPLVTFDFQGSNVEGTKTITAEFDKPMPAVTIPQKQGYIFDGYFTQPNGAGERYYNAGGKSAKDCDFTVNITLYANWLSTWLSDTVSKEFSVDSDGYISLSSADDLASLAHMVNYENFDTTNLKFKLQTDIDLAGKYWLGVGKGFIDGDFVNPQNAFRGVFDGNGHVINNLTTYDFQLNSGEEDLIGLFGLTSGAEIKNIIFANSFVSGREGVGTIIGWAEGTIIENCKIVSGQVKANSFAGGIAGFISNESQIVKTTTRASVNAEADLAGGIVASANSSNLTDCINYGNVQSNGMVGGICGEVIGRSAVSSSINHGQVQGKNIGAIIGRLGALGIINNIEVSSNANYGTLLSDNKIGAIIGDVTLSANDLVTIIYNSSVSQSSSQNVDFVGGTFNGLLQASYFQANTNSSSLKVATGSADEFSDGFRYQAGVNNSLPMQVELFVLASAIDRQDDVLSNCLGGFSVRN